MEELIDSVCDYVRKPYTDYAIMINGEWGSGKTYFWNNKLRSRLESLNVNGKTYKTIYMSLYGINSLDEISKKIFIETNPMLNKTLKRFVDTREGNVIPEFVKTGLDMANLFGTVNLGSEKVDFSKLFSIDDKILCFDDLERANVDVIDILGYINNFVEHDGIKTILICNERELATKFKNSNIEFKTMIASYILDKEGNLVTKKENKKGILDISKEDKDEVILPLGNRIEEKISDIFDRANAYERIKEKLIGETFEYIPEYAYILNGMIMKYSYNSDLSDFFKRNTHLIISAFRKSDTRNLRILKHALNDFEKIYDETLKNYPDIKVEILRTMLTFTIAMSFEIKAGNISKEKLKEINDNDEYNSVIFTSKILNDKNQFYLREFDNKYFLNDDTRYKFFKFIEVYIRTRYFDEKIFKDNLDIATNTITDEDKDSNNEYIKLLNGEYWRLSDTDFDILWRKVLYDIKLGKIDLKEYIKLFAIYKYMMDSNIIEYTISDLKHDFELGMQISASNYIKSATIIPLENETFETDDESIKYIITFYNSVRDKAVDEIAINKAQDLFKNLPNNILEFYKQIIGEYKQIPVFAKYDMDELYEKIKLIQNYDLYNFVNMIKERYQEENNALDEDIKNLKKFAKIIRRENSDRKKSIKNALLENLAKEIDKL